MQDQTYALTYDTSFDTGTTFNTPLAEYPG